jgi:hypothetical protein
MEFIHCAVGTEFLYVIWMTVTSHRVDSLS